MKKICHITTVHYLFDTRIFHKECKTLLRAGYDVTLIAPRVEKLDPKRKVLDFEGIKIILLPKVKNRILRMLFLTRQAYKIALEQKADIYHFHDPEFLIFATKLKKNSESKVIYDVHENYSGEILSKNWIPKFTRKIFSIIFNHYEKRKSKKIDFIIAAWPKIEEIFRKSGIRKIKIKTITNYPILNYFQDLENGETNKRNKKLIYVGGITRVRGVKEIIKSLAFMEDKEIKLILIGKFEEKGLEEEFKRMPEWGRVDFKGWLDQKSAYKEMSNSYLGIINVLPDFNLREAIPNKIFEYMAAGIPIVASDFPLWKKIIEGNKCGICVDPLKPKEIAKAVNYLIRNPEKAKKMGENGRKVVFEKYNWEEESKKLLKIYKFLS